MTNNLPFYALNETKTKKMFNIPTKKLKKVPEGIPWFKICNKKNIYLSTAIKCQYCNHLNHKKCSNNVKNNNNTCQECLAEMFPFSRLTKFLDKHNIIYEHQFGFQKNRSTTLAVLDINTRIIKALDDGNYAASVFLDFAKAFDTVNHEILIDELENYGVRGIVKNWFESYLKNRHQIVKIGDTLSDKMQITCGVPQGSILGPILFLLYINDIKNSSKILKFFLFADDTSTFLISKDIQELESIYNKELSYVTDWLNANKLTLNVKKSNLILFKNAKKPAKTLNIKIKGEQIEEKEYTKYLGILIDNKLSWNYHIKHTNLKISKGIGILTKLRRYLSKNVLRTLFYAFVQPHIDCGLLVWGSATPTNLKPIKKNLQKAVRKILFKARNQPIEPLFHELKPIEPLFQSHPIHLALTLTYLL